MSQQTETAREDAREQAGAATAPDREARIAHLLAIVEAQFGSGWTRRGGRGCASSSGGRWTARHSSRRAAAALENGDEPDFTFSPSAPGGLSRWGRRSALRGLAWARRRRRAYDGP